MAENIPSEEEILRKLVGIVKDVFPDKWEDEVVEPEIKLENSGIDSLDLVELVMEIEEDFNIELADKDIDECKTVEDLVSLIRNAIMARS